MTAGIYNFIIEQGTDFSRTLTWLDSNNNPVNLTGWTARMQIKDSDGNLIETLTSNVGGGITIVGSAGTITISISSAKTTAYTFDTAKYDLKLVNASSSSSRLVQGIIRLSPQETQ